METPLQQTAAPNPSDRLAIYAGKALGERLDRLVYDLERVADSAGADQVHDLRVSIRRLNSAAGVFKALIPKKASKAMRKKLSRLHTLAGEARDRDISVHLAEKGVEAPNKNLERLKKQRSRAAEKLQERVQKLLRRNPGSSWRRELRLPPFAREQRTTGPRAATFAAATLPEAARRFFAAGRPAVEGRPVVDLHSLRIRCKKLRYSIELFAPCYGSEIDTLLDGLKTVQDFLGDINDGKAARSLLVEKVSRAEAAAVRAELKERDRELLERFRRYWAETFDAPGELETWLLTLARGA